MSTLYRTPNISLKGTPGIEWHCSVEERKGRARRYFRFRHPGGMWQPLSAWPGHAPTGTEFAIAFKKFRLHMLQAMGGKAA